MFIPVHINNYFKVMKKHSPLGKQMGPHVSETVCERAANSVSGQQMHVKQQHRRLPASQIPPQTTRLRGRLDPFLPRHPSGNRTGLLAVKPSGFRGTWRAPIFSSTHGPRIQLHFCFFHAVLPTPLLRTLSPRVFLSLLSPKISPWAFMVGRA